MQNSTTFKAPLPIATVFAEYGMNVPSSDIELDRAIDKLSRIKANTKVDPRVERMIDFIGAKLRESISRMWELEAVKVSADHSV